MIVAITGANGFIGYHLCERFAASGATVRAIVRRDLDGSSIQEMLAGADVVVHAAGATRAPTRALLRASNVTLTQRIVDLARRANVSRFVFVSSQAAAGPA
ncbi:MAG: NAD-dependent epimerase/dehydratase family protein, partial [Deltaproteobacteria bacterium]